MQLDTIITIGSVAISIIASIIIYTYKITSLKMKYDEEIRLLNSKNQVLEKRVEKLEFSDNHTTKVLEDIKFALNLILVKLEIKIEEHKQV